MAKQANRMMIGAFVVIAVIVMAASLVVFGSGKFFQPTQKYVLYFSGSIMGLNVGSPVMFRGVPIGSVASIVIHADLATMAVQIPVIIEINPDQFEVTGGVRNPKKNIQRLVENGLRAVLTVQSYITGQLAIELNFYPGTAVVMQNINKEYMEIPTIPSTTQKLADALKKLNLQELEKHLESAMNGIAKLMNNPNLSASLQGLKETLQDTRTLVNRVDRQVEPLTKHTKKTVEDIGNLARSLDTRVAGVTNGLDKTLSAARGVISEDSPLIVNLENTLHEFSRMSRSLRQLADYLDQQPQSVIFGKKKPGDKQK